MNFYMLKKLLIVNFELIKFYIVLRALHIEKILQCQGLSTHAGFFVSYSDMFISFKAVSATDYLKVIWVY